MFLHASGQQQPIPFHTNGRGKETSGTGPIWAPALRARLGRRPRWEEWARMIAGRHAASAARWRPPPMLLALVRQDNRFLQQVIYRQSITLQSRFVLRAITMSQVMAGKEIHHLQPVLVSGHSPSNHGLGRSSISPIAHHQAFRQRTEVFALALVPSVERGVGRLHVRQTTRIQNDEIVRRLFNRGGRLEVFEAASSRPGMLTAMADRPPWTRLQTGAPEVLPGKPSQPPTIVYHRPVRRPEESVKPGEALPQGLARSSSLEPWQAVQLAQPSMPAMDVNHLTDQVIQTIDRRLTAWRERMGRF